MTNTPPSDDDERRPAPEPEAAEPGTQAPSESEAGGGEPSAAASPETGLEPVDPEPAPRPAEERASALEAQLADLQERLLRRRAEFENYRKRAERESARAADDGAAELLKELLPTLDDLERALNAAGSDGLREGVELIYRNLIGNLKGRGLTAEDPAGRSFDPELHEAVAHEPAPGVSAGTIVEVFQKGYLFKDRLLRPALVKVAAESGATEDAGSIH